LDENFPKNEKQSVFELLDICFPTIAILSVDQFELLSEKTDTLLEISATCMASMKKSKYQLEFTFKYSDAETCSKIRGTYSCTRGKRNGDCAHAIAVLAYFCAEKRTEMREWNRRKIGDTCYDDTIEFILGLKFIQDKKPPDGWGVVQNTPEGAVVNDISQYQLIDNPDDADNLSVKDLKANLNFLKQSNSFE